MKDKIIFLVLYEDGAYWCRLYLQVKRRKIILGALACLLSVAVIATLVICYNLSMEDTFVVANSRSESN